MEISRNILFFAEKEKGKDDAKLRMRVRWNKNVINFNVGYRIYPEKWNKESQRCKRNTTNAKKISASVINYKIQYLHDKAEEVFKTFELKSQNPEITSFRALFSNLIGKTSLPQKDTLNFFELLDVFVDERGRLNDWTIATFTRFKAVKSHLMGYDPQLSLELLDEDKLTGYVLYLRDVGKMMNSTIKK